ncbi:MAG TPA: hypothetical protein PLB81_02400 [Deltaproteobacteria bacterium]|nr:hypothetical protein [Deltaproteobacteria bacterium]
MSEMQGHDFFAGIPQVDVWAAGRKVKLPIFYRDARAHLAIFPAGLRALKRLLPDPRFTPAQFLPGIGAVALASFEYYDTDVGPPTTSLPSMSCSTIRICLPCPATTSCASCCSSTSTPTYTVCP